eukprot:NODE_4060_length_1121_cov_105.666333_g3866_i0.p1 GENE.NODE_4060_length_1121_cov_105.666333_g3866_i0~~NODE_4060_length_1121_cov_105.666333_g3866_i0.p1  ORF type:complete len:318 (-),score=29.48 NODE_4060_length_1121_cov_105.666333_g3866_i0:94-1047(-)
MGHVEERDAIIARFTTILERQIPRIWDKATVDALPSDCTLYACSDLHTDYPPNMNHILGLPKCEDKNSVLLVAGDISHRLEVVQRTLQALCGKYTHVFFVPGNHDLWSIGVGTPDSIEQFFSLLDMLDAIGVKYLPTAVSKKLVILPLFSWHTHALDPESTTVSEEEEKFDAACRWPRCINEDTDNRKSSLKPSIPAFFRALNEATRTAVEAQIGSCSPGGWAGREVASFSHFLPRRELFYGKLPLHKIMGDPETDIELRKAGSRVHVFGHSHLNYDAELDGVHYYQNAFGSRGSMDYAPLLIQLTQTRADTQSSAD